MYKFYLYYRLNLIFFMLWFVAAFNVAKSGHQKLEKFLSVTYIYSSLFINVLTALHDCVSVTAPVS